MQFKDNGANLGSPQSLNGSAMATFSTSSLAIGNNTITAFYLGDTNFSASDDSGSGTPLVQIVNKASTKTSDVTSSLNPALMARP